MIDDIGSFVEICGAGAGIAGAWLVALQDHRSRFGYWAFLISNMARLIFAGWNHRWFLFAQNLAFTGSSILGLTRAPHVGKGRGHEV